MSCIEGRCITIARVRAGMTSAEIARRLYCHTALVSMWERGKRNPWWDELYALLPELPKIREDGCVKYCPKSGICKKDGQCLIATSARTARRSKDIVEVVRCKDCMHHRPSHHGCIRCMVHESAWMENDFCSCGERGETDEP